MMLPFASLDYNCIGGVSEGLKSDRLKTMKTAVNLYFDIRQIYMMRSEYYRAKTIVYMQYVF